MFGASQRWLEGRRYPHSPGVTSERYDCDDASATPHKARKQHAAHDIQRVDKLVMTTNDLDDRISATATQTKPKKRRVHKKEEVTKQIKMEAPESQKKTKDTNVVRCKGNGGKTDERDR